MIILGLTGSIGMGKSTAAKVFRRLGVPVHDADGAVHALFARHGDAVGPIGRVFPEAVRAGTVDRAVLGARVFDDPQALALLEGIVHPLVRRAETRFLAAAARGGAHVVVLDIPLLFETGGAERCDAVVVVTAPPFIQARRVLERPGMTKEKLDAILARQVPDGFKRRHADFVVHTGLGKNYSSDRIIEIVRRSRTMTGRHWPPRVHRRRPTE